MATEKKARLAAMVVDENGTQALESLRESGKTPFPAFPLRRLSPKGTMWSIIWAERGDDPRKAVEEEVRKACSGGCAAVGALFAEGKPEPAPKLPPGFIPFLPEERIPVVSGLKAEFACGNAMASGGPDGKAEPEPGLARLLGLPDGPCGSWEGGFWKIEREEG